MHCNNFDVQCYHDRSNWTLALNHFSRYDYVHTYDFHVLSSELGEGEPTLYVVRDRANRVVICWPGLRRIIPKTDLFDLTSVYGYGGPLIRRESWSPLALDVLFDAMGHDRIVSLFSRMHPLFNENIPELLPYLKKISDVPIIDVDLQPKPIESYSRDHRSAIRRLVRCGAYSVVDSDFNQLDEFIGLYHQTMRFIDARSYFYFDRDFFDGLVAATDFKTILNFIKLDDVTICGSLMIQTGDILHGYLVGSDAQYRHLAPSKMLYQSAHEWAIENGLKAVVLGPGRSQENDSLLRFKQGFGRTTLPLHVFRKIINLPTYEDLCLTRGVSSSEAEFFPAYRAPV